MTAVLAAARNQGTAVHALTSGLEWLWRCYVTVLTAFAHHQVPPPVQSAVFAVTFTVALAIVFRRRKRSA